MDKKDFVLIEKLTNLTDKQMGKIISENRSATRRIAPDHRNIIGIGKGRK